MRYGTQRILPRYSEGVRKWDYGRAVKPRAVFIHIMDGYLYGTDDWFRQGESGITSTHFGIGSGSWTDRLLGRTSVFQWVDTNDTAWGANHSRWPLGPYAQGVFGDMVGRLDLNHAIIHIEVEGYAGKAWPSRFVNALNGLLAAIGAAHGPLWVMRHNDIQVKVCPGNAVPWGAIRPTYGQRLGAPTLPDTSPAAPSGLSMEASEVALRYRLVSGSRIMRAGKPWRTKATVSQTPGGHFGVDTPVRLIGRFDRTGSYDDWYVVDWYRGNGHGQAIVTSVDFK